MAVWHLPYTISGQGLRPGDITRWQESTLKVLESRYLRPEPASDQCSPTAIRA